MFIRIHLFRTDLPAERMADVGSFLSPREIARAERFRFEADRTRYIASHGILHEILGSYLGRSPGAVSFAYGIHGKPVVDGERGGLEFSLSHSGDLGMVGVARGACIGVDIEAVRPFDEAMEIAKVRFTEAEWAGIDSSNAFFALWTRKEAVAKCMGLGLSLPFDVFEVSPKPAPDPERVIVDWQGERSEQWLRQVPLATGGFVAAVATDAAEPPGLELAWQGELQGSGRYLRTGPSS